MANKDRPQGAMPHGEPLRVAKYVAGGTIVLGDFLKMDNTGRAIAVSSGDTQVLGVAASAAASGADVWVYDHPDQLFIAQGDDSGIAAQTNLGLNYDIVVGSAVGKVSGHEIDSSTGATSSTLPIRALYLPGLVGEGFGANAKVVFKINSHALNSVGTAGV